MQQNTPTEQAYPALQMYIYIFPWKQPQGVTKSELTCTVEVTVPCSLN